MYNEIPTGQNRRLLWQFKIQIRLWTNLVWPIYSASHRMKMQFHMTSRSVGLEHFNYRLVFLLKRYVHWYIVSVYLPTFAALTIMSGTLTPLSKISNVSSAIKWWWDNETLLEDSAISFWSHFPFWGLN